jgi:YVTN family beta-propeller protein
MSVIFAPDIAVNPTASLLATVKVGNNPWGVAVDPVGGRVFVGNDRDGTVSVITAATNAVSATVSVGRNPVAFGAFVTGAPVASGPSGPSDGDQVAQLQQQLDAANAALKDLTAKNSALQDEINRLKASISTKDGTIAKLEADNAALKTQIATLQTELSKLSALQAENTKLKADLAAANAQLAALAGYKEKIAALEQQVASLTSALDSTSLTLDSLVKRLMTGKTDANVAAVARDAAKQQVALAKAKRGPRDPRVRHAEKELADGERYFAKGLFQRSLKNFDEAYDMARRIIR